MPKAMKRAGLAGLACLATVAAGTLAPAASVTAARTPQPTPTKAALDRTDTTDNAGQADKAGRARVKVSRFGYSANVFGTKVLLGGIELRSLKDALVIQGCTRRTGLTSTASSLVSTSQLPAALRDIVDFSLSTSRTQTYHDAAKGIHGVRATSVLGDLSLGGEVLGVKTPRIVLEGLKSTADSYFVESGAKGKGRFGYDDSFGYSGLKLVLTDDDQISSTVSTLLGLLGIEDPTTVLNEVVRVPLSVLLDVISTLPLELPGLGSISLGRSTGSATAHRAVSEAYALKIVLDGIAPLGIPSTTLQLGRAISTISEPVRAGVFRSRMSALEANIGGLLRLGGVGQRALPCEGTGGKVVTRRVARAGIAQVLDVTGVKYQYRGRQQGTRATGFVATTIGEVRVLQSDVVLKGISSRVDLTSLKPNSRVTSTARTTVATLLVGGREVAVPARGRWMTFEDAAGQVGRLRTHVITPATNSFIGKHLTAVQIVIPGTNTTIDLGIANGEVFFR